MEGFTSLAKVEELTKNLLLDASNSNKKISESQMKIFGILFPLPYDSSHMSK